MLNVVFFISCMASGYRDTVFFLSLYIKYYIISSIAQGLGRHKLLKNIQHYLGIF